MGRARQSAGEEAAESCAASGKHAQAAQPTELAGVGVRLSVAIQIAGQILTVYDQCIPLEISKKWEKLFGGSP
jgi:hypothetical protein